MSLPVCTKFGIEWFLDGSFAANPGVDTLGFAWVVPPAEDGTIPNLAIGKKTEKCVVTGLEVPIHTYYLYPKHEIVGKDNVFLQRPLLDSELEPQPEGQKKKREIGADAETNG